MLRLLVALAIIAAVIGGAVAEPVRTMPSGTISLPAGATSADIDVVVSGDSATEADEPYTVTIASDTLQISQATASGVIINDDGVVAPVISVSAPTSVQSGTPLNVTLSRAGDKRSGDRVRWAIVPQGTAGVAEDDFPAVLEDVFDGSALGSEWCASDGSDATFNAPEGCPGIPENALYGSWEADLVTVSGGSLRLGINHDTGTWTTSQVVSKRAFGPGLLRYGVQFPAGKGGAHAIWRAPEDHYYGPGPRSGQMVDAIYFGKTSGERNKTWLSQLQYSGIDEFAEPAIAGQINDGTVWSASSRAAQTRWWKTDADGKTRFAFKVGNTVYWSPVEGDWPPTQSVTTDGTDEDGSSIQITWPGGGGASPFDRPMRIVMQSGVGDATSVACTGETSCPDAATLDGANVLVDYVRYYQFPTGEAIFQPGQDQITVSVPTRDSGVAGVRNLRFIAMDADDASISGSAGGANVAISTTGDPGVDHGEETYFLDFGLNAGGFTDSFGTTWENGNKFVTGGTALSDVVSGSIGGWTTDVDAPPTLTSPLVVTGKCIGDVDWPTMADMAGRDVHITFPTDRDCVFPKPGANNDIGPHFIGGELSNPANNIHLIGGKHLAPAPFPQTTPTDGWPNGPTIRHVKGTVYWEGAHIDQRCTCRDAIAIANVGYYEGGKLLTGDQPLAKTPKVIIVNSILENPLQCKGGVHGDIVHGQGTGTRPQVKLQNVVFRHGFQGMYLDVRDSPAGHGASRIELDHVQVYKRTEGWCQRIPDPGTTGSIMWGKAPRDGVWFYNTWLVNGATTAPAQTGFTAAGCATYAAGAGVQTSGWCRGTNPDGDPALPSMVGRNYDRAKFTTGVGSGPPTISGARVPRLDHTRLVGNTMQIVIPVDTTRGRQRLVTLGFSARDEDATGERKFDIAGNIVRSGYDIFANAGARDTETRITAPVTIGDDGYLRLTLTGTTGQAQINWMMIQRPTVSVTLGKAEYTEGETITATLTREGPTEATASMGWMVQGVGASPTGGSDFSPQAPSGTAVWASGATSRTATFTAVADGAAEPAEGFSIVLTGGTGVDIDPARSSASATIAASLGPPDPCQPGGADYPCTDPEPDECRPEGAVRGSPIRVTAGQAIRVRKAHLVAGLSGAVRGLNTTCAKANVCWGEGGCNDPKGLQADNPTTPFLSIDTAGRFTALEPGQRALDTFVYKVCAAPSYTTCTPVIADLVVTAPN